MSAIVTGNTSNSVPFVRVGSDPTLVVLNGGQGFVRRVSAARLARDARRVARILPVGQSFVLLGYKPEPAPDLSIDAIVAATLVATEELAPDRAIDLVGISYGGMVACRLATLRPDRFRRLVLVASGHQFSARGAEHVRHQIALLDANDMSGFARAFTGLFRRPLPNLMVSLAIALSRKRVVDGMSPRADIRCYLEAMLNADPVELERLTMPTLVIGGAADQFFGEGAMEQAAAAIPDAELRLLPHETHMAPAECAAPFRNDISRLLGAR